jgi:hypothetical protein
MSVTLTDGQRLRVSVKRILSQISGSGREEFTRGWKTCSVVNDMICNRIKSYEMCVGRMARNVKKKECLRDFGGEM